MKILSHFTLFIVLLSACAVVIPDYPPEQEWLLCNLATDENDAYYTAETASNDEFRLRHVEEAKRRNLYCPSDLPRTTPRMIPRASSTRVPPVAVKPAPAQSVAIAVPPTQSDYQSGLTAIIPNPQTPANQALAICRPQANAAKSQASNQASRPSRSSSYDTNCRRDYFGNYDCTSRESGGGGGIWGGLADGLASSSAGRSAYNSVLSSCLAQYGWRQ